LGNGALVSKIYAQNIRREIILNNWKLSFNISEDPSILIFKKEVTRGEFM
jgi:hypothetical protein